MEKCERDHVNTSHGRLATYSLGSGSPALLCLHPNSLNSRAFKPIFNSSIPSRHRVLAFDLPGHGESENASDPEKSYNMVSYAACAAEILQHFGIADAVALGSSLGGHVGLELIPLFAGLKGVMIVGTPPLPLGDFYAGFAFDVDWREVAPSRDDLSDSEAIEFAKACTKGPYEEWMGQAAIRTDQKARRCMFAHLADSKTSDQKGIVETSDVPVAVVNGKSDSYMRLDYIRGLKYKNLWRGECFELEGLQHMPFWEDPGTFMPLLESFIEDVS